jgi:hypothetical protein
VLAQEIFCTSSEGFKIALRIHLNGEAGFCILSYFFPVNGFGVIKEEFLNKSYREFNNCFFKLIDSSAGFLDRKGESRMVEFFDNSERSVAVNEYKRLVNGFLDSLERP